MRDKPKRAILFLAWGDRYISEMIDCIDAPHLQGYPIFLVTDLDSDLTQVPSHVEIVRVDFNLDGKMRKCVLGSHIPDGFDSLLFLDVDTRVLGDISLGFEKAERHGMALAQAAHYSMDHFQDFRIVMEREGVQPMGQLLYNTGVIFFSPTPQVLEVMRTFEQLGMKYAREQWSDQPYFSLALEKLGFNPYTLTTGYNHRAFGELISGEIRIWHSYKSVPQNIHEIRPPFPRRYEDGKIVPVKIPK